MRAVRFIRHGADVTHPVREHTWEASVAALPANVPCMAAGMVKREVCFSDQAAGHNTTMLLIAILGISLPTLMVNIGQVGILRRLANPSPSPNPNPDPLLKPGPHH